MDLDKHGQKPVSVRSAHNRKLEAVEAQDKLEQSGR